MNRRNFTMFTYTSIVGLIILSSIMLKNTYLKTMPSMDINVKTSTDYKWFVGIGRRKITPKIKVWLAGYGHKRVPYGKIHDLYVKVMALKDTDGKVVVLATSDNQGMSKTVYESIYQRIHQRFGIDRKDFMLTFSHNHSGPRLTDDLWDYYLVEEKQEQLVAEYSYWMGDQVVESVGEAL